MRIAMIAPVWIPIPPDGYGGIERVLALLVDELAREGHDVTLFAAGPHRTMARQVTYMQEAPTQHMGETLFDAYHVGQAYRDIAAGGYDVVHDHAGFLAPAFAATMPVPVVHTLHGPFTDDTRLFYEAFKDDCYYVAISRRQRDCGPHLNYLGVVPNAVDIDEHRYGGEKDDYLVYGYNRFQACRFGLDAVYVDPASGEHLPLRDHILATMDRIQPFAEPCQASGALAMLRQEVQDNRNDARWLRERQSEERLLGEVIRQAAQRFRGRAA